MPVRPSNVNLSTFGLKNPDTGNAEFFEAHSLPFGASVAVHGFGRVAESFETILAEIF